jgi:hypothetical protein
MMMPETEMPSLTETHAFMPPMPVSPAVIPINPMELNSFFPATDTGIKNLHAFIEDSGSCHNGEENAGAGNRPQHEVADIFRLYGDAYRRTHNLSIEQHNVMYAIEHCRTSAYGFHADICDKCGYIESAYNSCRNRHCPKCQGIAKRRWVEKRLDELLPVAYHHCVFTLPNRLSLLSLYNRKLIYNLLFDSSSQTLLTFGNDPRWLGALIGFYGILHTWSQTLWPHTHTHFIVTAGGLSTDGEWIEPKHKGKFLFPVKALSIVFRGKFIQGLKKAYYDGELVLPDNLKELENAAKFEKWINRLVSRNWVVHSKPPFADSGEVVRYIGRYTHRVAISNHRIISISDGRIRFSYKDNKEKDKSRIWKEMVLPADQFIERFLWHVLPKQYHRIRHYGFLTNGRKNANLKTIRNFLSFTQEDSEILKETCFDEADGLTCPQCGKGRLRSYLVTDRYGRILKLNISVFSKNKISYDTS